MNSESPLTRLSSRCLQIDETHFLIEVPKELVKMEIGLGFAVHRIPYPVARLYGKFWWGSDDYEFDGKRYVEVCAEKR